MPDNSPGEQSLCQHLLIPRHPNLNVTSGKSIKKEIPMAVKQSKDKNASLCCFFVWISWGITKCSLRLGWPFCFGVKNIFWQCKWKISLNEMSSENYIHTTTAPTIVMIRAGWTPPVLCEYLDNKNSLPQFILWGYWSSPLPYRKKKNQKTPQQKPN